MFHEETLLSEASKPGPIFAESVNDTTLGSWKFSNIGLKSILKMHSAMGCYLKRHISYFCQTVEIFICFVLR